MKVIGIIPARYASTRFPGKPLADIGGKSMLQRVYDCAVEAGVLDAVLVATDDERIAAHARTFGAETVMTHAEHPSGTDRCFEALERSGRTCDYVLNIQGDEPFLHREQVSSIAAACDGKAEIITQMIRCRDEASLFDTGEVKIVLNHRGEALYFSRSVIPFLKNVEPAAWHESHNYYRHVGMYAYRSDILAAICKLKPSALERAESLEQLRWLEAGYAIRCIKTAHDSHCVDTPADLERVMKLNGLA